VRDIVGLHCRAMILCGVVSTSRSCLESVVILSVHLLRLINSMSRPFPIIALIPLSAFQSSIFDGQSARTARSMITQYYRKYYSTCLYMLCFWAKILPMLMERDSPLEAIMPQNRTCQSGHCHRSRDTILISVATEWKNPE